MAWTPPTVAEFKTRFPVFASLDDDTVEMILDEAIGVVNDTWIETDRTPAVLYLTAHLLVSEGLGVSGAGGGGAAITGAIKRRKVDDVETEFVGNPAAGSSSESQFMTTVYGQRYYRLLRKSFPAVAWV